MVDQSIVEAARAVLIAQGHRAFGAEAAAAWPDIDPLDLLVEVIAEGLAVPPVADLGDSGAELEFMIREMADRYTHRPHFQAALLGLAAERVNDPAAARSLTERCTARGRANLTVVLRRAVARGDLPQDADFDLIHDIVAGAIAYRQVVGGQEGSAWLARQLVDMTLRGMAPLAAAPDPTGWPVQRDGPEWLELFRWFKQFGFGHLRPLAEAPSPALAAVPSEAVVDGHRLTVEAVVWRDFMPSTDPGSSRLVVVVNVVPVGGGVLPPFLRADRVAVVHADAGEVWVSPLVDETPRYRTSRHLRVVARLGPEWEPGTPVDVVVMLEGDQAESFPVRAAGCIIDEVS